MIQVREAEDKRSSFKWASPNASEFLPSLSVGAKVKKLKGCSSRWLQHEFSSLKKNTGPTFLGNRPWLLEYR